MKTASFFIGILVFLLFSCQGENKPAPTITLGKNYGPFTVDTSQAMSVEEMLKDYGDQSSDRKYTFRGKIEEVCSKAGCWINVDMGNGETFMARFKDHFTIPVRTEPGTEAFVHGVIYRDTISVEMLQHFAEDAGESEEEIAKITEPEYEIGFEADGIVLIESKKSVKKNK